MIHGDRVRVAKKYTNELKIKKKKINTRDFDDGTVN